MSAQNPVLRDFIYLDVARVQSLAAQLGAAPEQAALEVVGRPAQERLFLTVEVALATLSPPSRVGPEFDFAQWQPGTFKDGGFFAATGTVRLLDFAWLSGSLSGLPAVLRKMSKIEMEALKNSEQGRR